MVVVIVFQLEVVIIPMLKMGLEQWEWAEHSRNVIWLLLKINIFSLFGLFFCLIFLWPKLICQLVHSLNLLVLHDLGVKVNWCFIIDYDYERNSCYPSNDISLFFIIFHLLMWTVSTTSIVALVLLSKLTEL